MPSIACVDHCYCIVMSPKLMMTVDLYKIAIFANQDVQLLAFVALIVYLSIIKYYLNFKMCI